MKAQNLVLSCSALLFAAGCHTRSAGPAAPAPVFSPAPVIVPDVRVPKHIDDGKLALRRGRPAMAVTSFHRCLVIAPGTAACLDGKGRAHAALRQWEDAVLAWEELAAAVPNDEDLAGRLAAARRSWAAHSRSRAQAARHFPIGTASLPEGAPLGLRLAARFQRYSTSTLSAADVYDADIDSPKSVVISADGGTAYINSLEGCRTVVYDALKPAKRGVIRHNFGARQAELFPGGNPWFGYRFSADLPPEGPNIFSGKPVEGALSHGGRYLWIPYYRRDFDLDGTQPSAVAVVDTEARTIARVLPVGPIAKNVAASPDGRYMAVAHWGGNTVGFVDISSSEPAGFAPAGLAVLGSTEPLSGSEGMDRDRECGLCVRGLAWSPDSKTLFAGCMGGAGGVAVIDAAGPGAPELLGRVKLGGKPRDLAVSPDGKWLYAVSSAAGTVIRADAAGVARAALTGNSGSVEFLSVSLGGTPRSMRLSPDGKWLYVALNSDSQVAAVDAAKLEVVARVGADSFPVGLDLSPDGRFLWVTSQGIDGAGGNSVEVFEITAASYTPRYRVPPLP
jgi:DNA-binding beta-propeller fold protein YncE